MSRLRTRRLLVLCVATSTAAALTGALAVSTTGAAVALPAAADSTAGLFAAASSGRAASLAFGREEAKGEAEGPGRGVEAERYSDRAYPRDTIDYAQSKGAQASYAKLPKKRSSGTVASGTGSGGSTPSGTWTGLGPADSTVPAVLTDGGVQTRAAGRTTALAVTRKGSSGHYLFAGAAGGGVWRNADPTGPADAQTWTALPTGLTSGAIGSLFYDDKADVLYAGTGEPNGSGDSEAGRGLFRLKDASTGASTWALVPGSATTVTEGGVVKPRIALDRGIGSVYASGQHLLIGVTQARHGSSSVNGGRKTPPNADRMGLYESTDGGASFARVLSPLSDDTWFQGGVTSVQADPRPGKQDTLYASVQGSGLYRRASGTTSWTQIYTTTNPQDSLGGRMEFALAALGGGKLRIYLGDESPDQGVSFLVRTDDADAVTPKTWTSLSDQVPGTPGYASWHFCGDQCGYDEVVVSPPGLPDVVYIAGQMQYDEVGNRSNGRAVQVSRDGGKTFNDLTQAAVGGGKYQALHPDHHALAFVPGTNGTSIYNGSDGGVVRIDATPADQSGRCATRALGSLEQQCRQWLSGAATSITTLNKGLDTLQFQSLSTNQKGDLLGGTQDNGTWSRAGGKPWFETIYGDGGQSGIDKDGTTRVHTYYAASPDVNFGGDRPEDWYWIGDRLYNSREAQSFYIPIITDPAVSKTFYAGLQHVWRTKDAGGDPAYLKANCANFGGDGRGYTGATCGDWEPLGGGTGGTQGNADTGNSGDLTSPVYGSDRAGQFVVATERAPSDTGTLWAATRTGRVFVSKNSAAEPAQAVKFSRIDTPQTPGRFVSGISVDPADPNHAWVSYSGYSAYAAGGHVYEVRFDPASSTARWTDLSYDLGDQPVTDVVRTANGDLYASTDSGVAHLSRGASGWDQTSGDLPIVAVYGLTLAADGRVLAATHGRGAWALTPTG
ncbi:MAG: hypothetical protein JWN17_1670 [Frankiales bacterium]|nr:hypothetical protein [Frankiales bacterium]